jgi:hypothetical protein
MLDPAAGRRLSDGQRTKLRVLVDVNGGDIVEAVAAATSQLQISIAAERASIRAEHDKMQGGGVSDGKSDTGHNSSTRFCTALTDPPAPDSRSTAAVTSLAARHDEPSIQRGVPFKSAEPGTALQHRSTATWPLLADHGRPTELHRHAIETPR